MDPQTAGLLSDVAIILGGLATGVLVAKITADRTRSQERERRRLDLIGTYLAHIEKLRDQGQRQKSGQPLEDFGVAQDLAHAALTQLQIIEPRLERPGLDLWHSAQRIVMAAQLRAYAPPASVPVEAQDADQLDEAYVAQHKAFIEAARRVF